MNTIFRLFALYLFFLIINGNAFSQPFFTDDGGVFRNDILPRVDIFISEDSLQWIYDNIESDREFRVLFIFSAGNLSDTIPDAGFRLRGNTSRYSGKKSFKISFNTFSSGRKFYGLEKMNLNGEHNDPSIIRSKLSWDLFKQMEVVGSRCNYVELYINNRYYGLYVNVEHIDEEFTENRYGNKIGNLYKCTYPASMTYLGNDKEDYRINNYILKNNLVQDDYSDLINLISKLHNSVSSTLPANIEPIFNVNSFLRYLAVEVFTSHWDGYSFNKNNFYLFNNLATGKFEFIPYDVDNTFGIDWFNIDWANRNIYSWWNLNEARPLTSKILGNQVYKDRYSFFLHELITRYASTAKIFPEIDEIKSKINASAALDEYRVLDYGWTYADYDLSFSSPLGNHVKYGLKPHITNRINSINQQLVLNPIAPIIENVYHSTPELTKPLIVALNITDDEANPTGILYYTVNGGDLTGLTLQKNSVNKFIAEIPSVLTPGSIKYYIEASDASNNTSREPVFGEYSVSIGLTDSSLIINEFMAGNSNTIVDNYGQKEDWIEIKNISNTAVSLAGKYLTDDFTDPMKFKLPNHTIEPGGYYIIWADDDTDQGQDHAGFKLSAGGESIGIYDTYERNFAPLHTISYSVQEPNISSGINSSGQMVSQSIITPFGDNNSKDVAFITFRFNMNNEILQGNFWPSIDFVDVAGTFNSWNGGIPIYDANNDGIYQFTAFGFTTNESIEYKARINSNWGTAEFPELGGDGNRLYTLHSGHNILSHIYNREGTLPDGIKNNETGADYTLYPNPCNSGNFTVNASFTLKTIQIYSLTGTLLFQTESFDETSITVSANLARGIYIVKITGLSEEYVSRLIVY